MICRNCGSDQADSDKFCRKCGALLHGKCCPSCGIEIAETDTFCPRCGARCDGKKTCPVCGTLSEKDDMFCGDCGAGLAQPAPTSARPAYAQVAYAPRTRSANKAVSSKAVTTKKIALITRNALFAACSLVIFICSFFNVFSVGVNSALPAELRDIKIRVSAVQMVGAMFRVGNIGSLQDNSVEYMNYVEEHASTRLSNFITSGKDIEDMPSSLRRELSDLMSRANVLKLILSDDITEQSPSLVVRVVLWGVLSLGIMLLSLATLTLSVLLLVFGLLGKQFKFKSGIFFVLLFALPMLLYLLVNVSATGAGISAGGGIVTIMIFALLGLAAEPIYRYIFDRSDAVRVKGLVSAGVSFVLAAVMLCCLGGSVMTTTFRTGPVNQADKTSNYKVTIVQNYNGLFTVVDFVDASVASKKGSEAEIDTVYLEDYMEYVNSVLKSGKYTASQRRELLQTLVTPVMIFNFKNYAESMPAGMTVNIAAYLAFFGMAVVFMLMMIRSYRSLCDGGSNPRSFDITALALTFLSMALVITDVIMLNAILGMSYGDSSGISLSVGIGATAIIPFAFMAANLVQKLILGSWNSRRRPAAVLAGQTYAPLIEDKAPAAPQGQNAFAPQQSAAPTAQTTETIAQTTETIAPTAQAADQPTTDAKPAPDKD